MTEGHFFVTIFFEGNYKFTRTIKVGRSTQINYRQLLGYFFEFIAKKFGVNISTEPISIYELSICWPFEYKPVCDFRSKIQPPTQQPYDLLITNSKIQSDTIHQNLVPTTAKAFLNIKKGKEFESKNKFNSSRLFYEPNTYHGLLSLCQMYLKTHFYSGIEPFLDKLNHLPKTPEIGQIIGKTIENIHSPEKLHECLNVYEQYDLPLEQARVHLLLDQLNEAEKIERSYANKHSIEYLELLVKIKCFKSEYKTAIELCLQHPKLFHLLSDICEISDTGLEAIRSYKLPIKGLYFLAKSFIKKGKIGQAISLLGDKKDFDLKTYLLLFSSYLDTHDFEKFKQLAGDFFLLGEKHFPGNDTIKNIFDFLRSSSNKEQTTHIKKKLKNASKLTPDTSPEFVCCIALFAVEFFRNGLLENANIVKSFISSSDVKIQSLDRQIDVFMKIPVLDSPSTKSLNHSNPQATSMMLLGNEDSILLGNINFLTNNHVSILSRCFPIPGFSLWTFFKKKPNRIQYSIQCLKNLIPQYEVLMFMVPINDIEMTIPLMIRKCLFNTPSEAIRKLVIIYFEFLKSLLEMKNNLKIVLLPAIPTRKATISLVYEFNQLLAQEEEIKKYFFLKGLIQPSKSDQKIDPEIKLEELYQRIQAPFQNLNLNLSPSTYPKNTKKPK